MPRKGTTSRNTGPTPGKPNGHHTKSVPGSALTQKSGKSSDRTTSSHTSADELALRAWQTTYKNSKGKEA
jgi:hypothetical protein